MARPGRNESCRCGSGKKYKRCCLAQDDATARSVASLAQPSAGINWRAPEDDYLHDHLSAARYDQLADAADAVQFLIETDRVAEAETAAQALLENFPDAYDGHAKLGLIFELRGDYPRAIAQYRHVIAFARTHPKMVGPRFIPRFQELIDRLELQSQLEDPRHHQ